MVKAVAATGGSSASAVIGGAIAAYEGGSGARHPRPVASAAAGRTRRQAERGRGRNWSADEGVPQIYEILRRNLGPWSGGRGIGSRIGRSRFALGGVHLVHVGAHLAPLARQDLTAGV